MHWYHYLAWFFAGAFFANMGPHFVNGIQGNRFPTPFAKPPGRGLSSPLLNLVWAMINLTAGGLLLYVGMVSRQDLGSILAFAAGVVLMNFELSRAMAIVKKQ